MCGRYTLTNYKQLEKELGLEPQPELDFAPRFNLAPTQLAPIITSSNPRSAVLGRWGLLPSHAGHSQINARSEKALTDPTYSKLLRTQRCLVPASGFIEWLKDNNRRRPHLLSPRGGEALTMAGLWRRARNAEGVLVDTFLMFTTDASAEVAPLHDRMPVFLQDKEARALWLSDTTHVDELARLMQPWLGLETREISSRVNDVRNDDAACFAPPSSSQLQLF